MMIAFPLLERYLRQKVQLSAHASLNDDFYLQLARMFPALAGPSDGRKFWQVFRNGLLHVVTMSTEDRRRNPMPGGSLSHDLPGISKTPDGSFFVHPVHFAERVFEVIESDFSIFEGISSAGRLPTVKAYAPGIEASTLPFIIGTNTDP